MKTVKFFSAQNFKKYMKSFGFISQEYNYSLDMSEYDFAVISIGNIEYEKNYSENDLYINGPDNHWLPTANNVLNINFADVDNSGNMQYDNALTTEQANDIVKFIEENKDKTYFFIHCSAGISRSGAVARYIIDTYNCDYENYPSNPNFYVLTMLKRIYREKYECNI